MNSATASAASPHEALARAARLSRYVQYSPAATLPAPDTLTAPISAAQMRAFLDAPVGDEAGLNTLLRKLRRAVMLHLIVRDLGGLGDLGEVMTTVTTLAEETVRCALAHFSHWLAMEYGQPIGERSGQHQQLHVVAMGKLGGRELNASSDIDLIFLYPEEGETDGTRRIANQDYFNRLARKLIGALAEITPDGFVFRVDTRLRPYGDSGPLTMHFDMLDDYLVTQGREWERYAWVKARVIAGDHGNELHKVSDPFVFRRHLDFGAIGSLRALHAQIRREAAQRDIAGNIKLGPGGIREIEFLAQVFQIMRGGGDPALRLPGTLPTLAVLEQKRLLPEDTIAELRAAYVFLRNLEHRLQYLDDHQTQTLPPDADDRNRVADMMGCADYNVLLPQLELHRNNVARHFAAMFAGQNEGRGASPCLEIWDGSLSGSNASGQLGTMGFSNPAHTLALLEEFKHSARYRRMAASGQLLLDQVVPRILEAASKLANPDVTLARTLSVLEAIGRRESYLSLLMEYPAALDRLARLACASPWAAQYLAQHPILLDELIAPREGSIPDWGASQGALRESLRAHDGNTENQMDLLRHFKQTHTLRLLMADLAGTLPLETLSDHLSDLADALLKEVLHLAWNSVRQRHTDTPKFAIIAYGKLGGRELGYASDLDLVFLYDDNQELAAENYARLAQRISTWLTSTTSVGVLYDTDLRLRPNGAAGLLVSQIDAFHDYQLRHAWVWEHQALTRARFVAGDTATGTRFEAIRNEILCQPRERKRLQSEILAMREKMHGAHPNPGEQFDIKHDRGGIIDLEFAVQFLVLLNASRHAALTANAGNLALLKLAATLALIPRDLADPAHEAYRRLRRLQHSLRLQSENRARVDRASVAEIVAAVTRLWNFLFEKPA
ncbi:MAG: bifunctional [glutamate--ammonia ligase]-adenylyl-L-tyrosine phosphorylase/[glutamate--ammonia-ligase] adenylyltransferase [Burkholderiales bacterium]